MERVDAAAPRDTVLAIGGEDEVLREQRPAASDLRRLLAEQLRPDAEFAVALQRGGLGVESPGQHHVAIETADGLILGNPVALGIGGLETEVGALEPLPPE